jgi:hypothetical protein
VKLVNETALLAAWTVGFRRDGRELFVVVAKGTYPLVGDGGEPALAEQQMPILKSDVLGPDPATTAPRLEADFAHGKRMCDVLVHGDAHAPDGSRVPSLLARLRIGAIDKSIRVIGPRVWVQGAGTGLATSHPVPFATQSILYDDAFGGTERHPTDEAQVATFLENPVGRGYRKYNLDVDGAAMPSTEEVGRPVTDPRGTYRPMSFGPLGRSWTPRAGFAGTYDARWLETRCPLWPDDFDDRYFQAAPADQQMPFPHGGETIELTHLVPASLSRDASARARLPRQRVGAIFVHRKGASTMALGNLDTVVIEPGANRFTCTWRMVQPMERDIFDIQEFVVGDPDGGLVGQARARAAGKQYVAGLDKLPPKTGGA